MRTLFSCRSASTSSTCQRAQRNKSALAQNAWRDLHVGPHIRNKAPGEVAIWRVLHAVSAGPVPSYPSAQRPASAAQRVQLLARSRAGGGLVPPAAAARGRAGWGGG